MANPPNTKNSIFDEFVSVGRAIFLTGGNNTHSGNISCRHPTDRESFYITSSGSQQGALIPSDIVPLRFSSVSWGDGRASTESTIHRRILAIPNVEASIHCHYIAATIVTFDTRERQNFLIYEGQSDGLDRFTFVPIDRTGLQHLGNVSSDSYDEPVGSVEMEERIPAYLAKDPVTLVKGHGPFVRGESLATCLHLLNLIEASARLKLSARQLGVDTRAVSEHIRESSGANLYPTGQTAFDPTRLGYYETDDKNTIAAFLERARFNFYRSVSPFGTGSMSEKVAPNLMLYCPMASAPDGYGITIYRMAIDEDPEDNYELSLHKALYRETSNKSCMFTMSPLATAESMASISRRFGTEALIRPERVEIDYDDPQNHPVVKPIDAEAVYLNPQVGLVNSNASFETIFNMLRWHKGACFIAGVGAIGAGNVSLEQAAHHAASGENLARIRHAVHLNHHLANGPTVSYFEPETE